MGCPISVPIGRSLPTIITVPEGTNLEAPCFVMLQLYRHIKPAFYYGHRGKRQGGTDEWIGESGKTSIPNQQEFEQHKTLAPKASQSEGFLKWSLTMFTSKKKKVWKYHRGCPCCCVSRFLNADPSGETESIKQQQRIVEKVHCNFLGRGARKFSGLTWPALPFLHSVHIVTHPTLAELTGGFISWALHRSCLFPSVQW